MRGRHRVPQVRETGRSEHFAIVWPIATMLLFATVLLLLSIVWAIGTVLSA